MNESSQQVLGHKAVFTGFFPGELYDFFWVTKCAQDSSWFNLPVKGTWNMTSGAKTSAVDVAPVLVATR
jgi:hypothetical protein